MLMRSRRELWWFLLLERRYGTIWGMRLDVYLPALLCWTLSAYERTRRSYFSFLFSFVHYLEISPDLKLIVTDCCELAVLRFSTTYDLGMTIVLLAMRCILIKHNVHIGFSPSKGKGIPLY